MTEVDSGDGGRTSVLKKGKQREYEGTAVTRSAGGSVLVVRANTLKPVEIGRENRARRVVPVATNELRRRPCGP